jgi:hypothetical protein
MISPKERFIRHSPKHSCIVHVQETIHPFFLRTVQVEMQERQVPPAGGVAYIHRAEAQGLSPRFGKDLLMLHDTIHSLIAATTTTSLSTASIFLSSCIFLYSRV